MQTTFAICTDLHFGPEARHEGKLRKLTAHAGQLLRGVVGSVDRTPNVDFLVNLGDDIEDEGFDADLARYRECIGILDEAKVDRLHVAGNHDTINLRPRDLTSTWDRSAAWAKSAWSATGKLHYSVDRGGIHLVVLHTVEIRDTAITVDDDQLAWLEADLRETELPGVVFMHHSAADQHLVGNRWFEGRAHVCLVRERKRLRSVLEAHASKGEGGVLAVFNGHLHWNHVDVINGLPYVTVQSLVENLDEDAPGRPAAAYALVTVTQSRVVVEVRGVEPARYQFDRPR